ncbi:MAG: hypothetical protein ACKOXR_05815, partial [Bacteroidota bacterium]
MKSREMAVNRWWNAPKFGHRKGKRGMRAYFCGMPKLIQLKFTPAEIGDEAGVNRKFCREAGLADGVVVWKKKSLDARGRQPYFLVTAEV